MSNIWQAKSGTKLATITEGLSANVSLPVNFPSSIQLISGNLPPGLELTEDFRIQGVPDEVAALKEFRFVLRATKGAKQEDRTFSIDVLGEDAPTWVTPSGLLPVGTKQTFFVFDNSLVNFQLQVIDNDTRAGETLSYFIPSNGGELPPGLHLTEDGKLIGTIEPIPALESDAGRGAFDENRFDKYPYDFALENPDDRTPKKLNQFYRFEVAVSDGDSIAQRTFEIFVVAGDFLRADNTILEVGEGVFTADNTYVRSPIWITPANLGTFRANNNLTILLDVLNPVGTGAVSYKLEDLNPNNTASVIPPGTSLDTTTGEIFGRLPYQPAVKNSFTFTVTATRSESDTSETASSTKTFTIDIIGEVDSTIQWLTKSDLGTVDSNYRSILKIEAQTTVPNSFLIYNIVTGNLPPGLELYSSGEIVGQIDNSAISETQTFSFTAKAQDQFRLSEITKTFTLSVRNIDDTIYSDIYYVPLLPESKRNDFYKLISNPDIFEPDLIYRPEDSRFGIQQNINILVYSGLEISTAKNYVSSIALYGKRKTLKVKDIKTAIAKEPGSNRVVYEVVYLDVYDPYESEASRVKKTKSIDTDKSLTVDSYSFKKENLFETQSSIAVGTRLNPSNRVFFRSTASIEIRDTSTVSFDTQNITTRIGEITPNQEIGSSTNIKIYPEYRNTITSDSNVPKASDTKLVERYISNISNLRESIQNIGNTERDYLPLWMRTAQPGSVQELGYTLAIPLCYCTPGNAEKIKRAIDFSGLDFRQFELEVDRIYVEKTEESSEGAYYIFSNKKHTI